LLGAGINKALAALAVRVRKGVIDGGTLFSRERGRIGIRHKRPYTTTRRIEIIVKVVDVRKRKIVSIRREEFLIPLLLI
jgi:hypothetical protein